MFANRRFCETLGRPLEELPDKTDADLFPARLAEKYRRDDQQVLATGPGAGGSSKSTRRPDGEVIYVQILKAAGTGCGRPGTRRAGHVLGRLRPAAASRRSCARTPSGHG